MHHHIGLPPPSPSHSTHPLTPSPLVQPHFDTALFATGRVVTLTGAGGRDPSLIAGCTNPYPLLFTFLWNVTGSALLPVLPVLAALPLLLARRNPPPEPAPAPGPLPAFDGLGTPTEALSLPGEGPRADEAPLAGEGGRARAPRAGEGCRAAGLSAGPAGLGVGSGGCMNRDAHIMHA